MPRKNKTQKKSNLSSDLSVVRKFQNETLTSSRSHLNETYVNLLEQEVGDRYEQLMGQLHLLKEDILTTGEIEFHKLLLRESKDFLKTPIDMNGERMTTLFDSEINLNDTQECMVLHTVKKQTATVHKRRSKSVKDVQLTEYKNRKMDVEETKKKRSCSVDTYNKAHINKMALSAFINEIKYSNSVVENSGIRIKRIMKPDEEAISKYGSPLLTRPVIPTAPSVNIPLPGGVVMNIEPKQPKGHFAVPELDEETKLQLKLLCQQLNHMI